MDRVAIADPAVGIADYLSGDCGPNNGYCGPRTLRTAPERFAFRHFETPKTLKTIFKTLKTRAVVDNLRTSHTADKWVQAVDYRPLAFSER